MSRFKELVKYLYKARKKGLKKSEIESNLKTMGWSSLWIWLAWKRLDNLSKRKSNTQRSKKSIYLIYSSTVSGLVLLLLSTLWVQGFIYLKGPELFRPDLKFAKYLESQEHRSQNIAFSFNYTDGNPQKNPFKWSGEGKLNEIYTEGQREFQVGINSKLNFENEYPTKHLLRINTDGVYLKNFISQELENKLVDKTDVLNILNKWTKISDSGQIIKKPNDITLKLIKESKINKFLGFEKSEYGLVLLYELSLNPDLFIKAPSTSYESFKGTKNTIFSPSSLTLAISPIAGNFEYIEFVGYGPSFLDVVGKIYAKKSDQNTIQNDKQRLSDLQGISNELERFYNRYQGYPESILGKPELNKESFKWPTAPEAESGCSEFYNTYWYTAIGEKTFNTDLEKNIFSDYKVTFCLGSQIDNHDSGVSELTSKGIKAIPCENDPYCSPSTLNIKGMLKSERFWQDIPTNSRLEIKILPDTQ